MMIKTPIKVCLIENFNVLTEADGAHIGDFITEELANDAANRINMHDELVSMLKDIALVDGGSECIKSKIARARELLGRCK